MRLLPLEAFARVMEPLLGRRIGFVSPEGNVGDRLIEAGTLQLFGEYGVRWTRANAAGPLDDGIDVLVFGGGGNMGTLYRGNWELRGRLLTHGLPIVILPQSFTSAEERRYETVFVRETASLAYCPGGILAPDLALGLESPGFPPPRRGLGIFIRRDKERLVRRPWLSYDPAKVCRTPEEYLQLAARYETVITDRLHFAISALLAGRKTTLLANSYHKNEFMHQTWLADLGCQFAHTLEEATSRRRAA